MITNFYVDGFNLYYRAVKETPFKWLNLRRLAETLLPGDTIQRVCYFTAPLLSRPNDPTQPQRQQTYLRALMTLSGFEVYFGAFRPRTKLRPLVKPVAGLPTQVLIRDSEEKGSDVNLATRLLVDGFRGDYEQAVVVSNDADFAGAMRYVRDDLGLRVTLVNPDYRNSSAEELSDAATYVKRLWKSHLRRSQFPNRMEDATGVITKPSSW
ncbi:MAG: NYN domain-containing protein [Chloroflexi bacterium]|nr:NYN domain-containing protein [Chloroflexota bacterium]MCY3939263.1 NYN domain-containing protein [Chloroflexota bacterium]